MPFSEPPGSSQHGISGAGTTYPGGANVLYGQVVACGPDVVSANLVPVPDRNWALSAFLGGTRKATEPSTRVRREKRPQTEKENLGNERPQIKFSGVHGCLDTI